MRTWLARSGLTTKPGFPSEAVISSYALHLEMNSLREISLPKQSLKKRCNALKNDEVKSAIE
jgi:hypothetical protein